MKRKTLSKKALIVAIVGILAVLAAGTITGMMVGASSVCGNKVCEVGENPAVCSEDCVSVCGDSVCHPNENFTCKMDCTGNFTLPAPESKSLLDGIIDFFS